LFLVVLGLTHNSFTSKYTNITCIKLRERPHIISSDRGDRAFQTDDGVKKDIYNI